MSNQYYPLVIKDIRPETDEAVCITFEVAENLKYTFDFIQGQFLTLKANIDGEDVSRSYSICSGVYDESLQVAIKRVKGGKFSNFANDVLKAGDEILVMPPQGSFYSKLDVSQHKNYMCIAAGSGITPVISIIKTILQAEPQSRVTLIYGNRRSNTVMFRDSLSFIKNRYLTRFQWINIMDEEDQGSDLLNGHIDNKKGAALQQAHQIDIYSTDEAFICGPEAMMSEVSRGFRASGMKDENIHYELFSSSLADAEKVLQKSQQRKQQYGEEKTSKVTIVADGRRLSFDLAAVGENILDAGQHHGMELPHSCKAGVCSTCKAKLIKGKVDMDITHGLEPREVEQGYILTCQAHPVSAEVEIDFDQR
jgi:ring-1,2-phenylacetyl-CoA epoxidase subunit PaaE